MSDEVIYITVEQNGRSLYRAFSPDYFAKNSPEELGEEVEDMYESLTSVNK